MPNWCINVLKVGGSDEELKAFSEKAKSNKKLLSFKNFSPPPVEIVSHDSDILSNEEYNWRVENWGTKWDLDDTTTIDREENQMIYKFDTAWAPPVGAVRSMSNQFPKLAFRLEAVEPGMAFGFIGEYWEGDIEDEVDLEWDEACKALPELTEPFMEE